MFSIRKMFSASSSQDEKPVISFEGTQQEPLAEESVLDTLLRHDHQIPYGCRAGACQSCMMISEQGEIPADAQENLTPAEKEQGYFLACQCKPQGSMSVALKPTRQEPVIGTVVEKAVLNSQVARLRVRASMDYRAGQFVNLYRNGALYRSYSLASVPALDNYLEFHIKRVEGGKFSPWIYDELQPGVQLALEGPKGLCFYTPLDPQQPLLLAGLGTGLAPLYGVLRDALITHNHQGPIHFIVGAKHSDNLYYLEELKTLAQRYANLSITFVAQESQLKEVRQGDIYQQAQALVPNCKGYRVYLCGADSFVKKMKKQCFVSGALMADILTDSFLPSGS